jgi:3-hydroxybutyryl-CoA dehydrogenase
MTMTITTLAVVGSGQMGSGIAQVAASAGINVVLIDVASEMLNKAMERIDGSLQKLAKKGGITAADATAAKGRIRTSTSAGDAKGADFAIEAITENEGLKKEVFHQLDEVVRAGGVIASNTSSISITRLAASTKRPDAVVGMHFMNPVPLMQLVEVIRGAQTSEPTYQATLELARRMGKTVVTAKDYPGFIVNRILIPMLNEASFALMEGIGTAEDIDTAMKLGTNQPMGPLALADFVGLDTCLYIAEVLHKGLGDDKYRPCPLLRQYVDAGWLGKKSGRGFYNYA